MLEAGDGEAGLRLIEQNGERIDVVLTDLLMPGIDGYDVVDVLAAYRPDLPVACMSGFASHTSVGRTLVAPFIPKPFNAESLRGLLQPLIVRARELRERAPGRRFRPPTRSVSPRSFVAARTPHGPKPSISWRPRSPFASSARAARPAALVPPARAWRNWQTRRT